MGYYCLIYYDIRLYKAYYERKAAGLHPLRGWVYNVIVVILYSHHAHVSHPLGRPTTATVNTTDNVVG